MKLAKLLAALPDYRELNNEALASTVAPALRRWPAKQVDIKKITSDSRRVEAGSMFVAYQGVSQDGHYFIPEAIAGGAAAVICEDEAAIPRPLATGVQALSRIAVVPDAREALAHLSAAWYSFPARRLLTVGITGTDGKTTTTNYLFQMLTAGGKKASMINTVNAVIGNHRLETGLHTTTPDAPDVQQYLADMVEAGTEICILETTSHGLAQHRVTACDFDIAIVTNITHEHLDIHGSLEEYRSAKASLFESLSSAADKGLAKTAILNCDDWSFEFLKEKLAGSGTAWLGYSIADHPQATVTAHNIAIEPAKTTFSIHGSNYVIEIETRLLGDYNVSNCLAAATAAIEVLEISPPHARDGISALPGVPGRMERIDEGQPYMAIVDFAHTPNSLRRSLRTARQLTAGRVIAVFGCAGLRDVAKRVLMGEIAAELADLTIITAEDPRTEDLDSIIAATAQAMQAKGGIEGTSFERVPDRGWALYRATQLAQPGDIVLALGKGHEQSMCFGEIEYPWDDRLAMRAALRGEPLTTLPSARQS